MCSVRRKNSPIWSYFTVIDENNKKCRCDMCGLIMSYRATITNMKTHLVGKHPTIDLKLDTQPEFSNKNTTSNIESDLLVSKPSSSTDIPEDQENVKGSGLREHQRSSTQIKNTQTSIASYLPKKVNVNQKKKLDKLLLKLFTDDFQPFSIVENKGFRQFVQELNPSYEIPSRKVISNNFIPAAYEECRTEVKLRLKNITKVCLTTDCWSSVTNESYLALTAHYITANFQIESALLDCVLFEGSHTSVHLANKIKKITDSFDISEKILLVVSDNAANIVGAIRELQWKQFGCYAHTLNLIVNDALQHVKSVQDLIQKSRNIVTFFRRSNLATAKLIKYQKDLGDNSPKKLIQDVSTRWNSCYYMLERLIKLQDAVKTSLALSEKSDLNLNADEWKMCREMVEVLKPFEAVTKQMSSEGFVTGSQIIVVTSGLINVCSLLKKRAYNNNVIDIVSALDNGLSTRLKHIEFSKTAGMCTFLDPRFKLHAFSSEAAKNILKKHVQELLVKLEKNESHKSSEASPPLKQKKKESEKGDELSEWSLFDSIMEKQPKRNTTSRAIIEVDRYIEETLIDRKNDPLQWWETNHHQYPNLGILVKTCFPMMATSVPCERIFSKTGLIINDRRTRLKASKVRELVFLNYNSKFLCN